MAPKREASSSPDQPSSKKIRKILVNSTQKWIPSFLRRNSHRHPVDGDRQVEVDRDCHKNNSADAPINDLEQAIMQKTFTRDEVDRLIGIVRSRTSDVSPDDERGRFETSAPQPLEPHIGKGKFPVHVDEIKSHTLLGTAAPPPPMRSNLEEDISSPTELAKAYMGRRSLRATPSQSLHNQAFREDISRRTSLPYTPKTLDFSFRQRTVEPSASFHRGSENGYLTPGRRPRSGTQNWPLTPYSRVNQTARLKGVDPMTEGKVVPSISLPRSWKGDPLFDGKQSAKRRISVLDDLGSVGPIRRTRQKTNMMYPSASSISSTQKSVRPEESMFNTSVLGLVDNEENSISRKRSTCIPSQSTETARRILEQLNKCMHSPKGKSPEIKTSSVETSPSKSIQMLQGKTQQCVDDLSKLVHKEHHIGILGELRDNDASVFRDLAFPKQGTVSENGPMIPVSEDRLSPQGRGIVSKRSTEDDIFSSTRNADISCTNAFGEKQTFEKNENKDLLELQKNSHSSPTGTNSLENDKAKHDKAATADGKDIAEGTVTLGEPMSTSSDVRPTESFDKNSSTAVSDNYAVTNAPGTVASLAASTSLPTPVFNVSSVSSKPTGAPFSFSSRGVDKATLLPLSSASVVTESIGLNGQQSEAKVEVVSRESAENVKADDESLSKTVPASLGIFSFHASNNSTLNNESNTSSSLLTATTDKPKSNGLFAPLSSITTTTSVTAPKVTPSTPSFIFGASAAPATGTVSAPAFTWNLPTQSTTSSQTVGLTGPISSSTSGSIFGSSYMPSQASSSTQSAAPSSVFGTCFSNTGFNFGSSSSAQTPSSLGSSSPSMFSFTATATPTPTPPPLSNINDEMSVEKPSSSSQPSPFVFGGPSSSSTGGSSMFQFSTQQNPFSAGTGVFSIGAGGGGGGDDKSKRRIVKINRNKLKKR
ncbi:hypothetical protein ACHQM5_019757 [Ranunculus cassubicifolius]